MTKPIINILWLDDLRDPYKYLKHKDDPNNRTLTANLGYYRQLMEQYELNFTWVKTFEQFTEYIMRNGIPEMVSFDYDLGKGLVKGSACAAWLVNFCKKKGQPMPKTFIHSANPRGSVEIANALKGETIMENKSKTVKLNETQLRNMIAESIKKMLNEIGDTPKGQFMLGRLASRNYNDYNETKDINYFSKFGNDVCYSDERQREQGYDPDEQPHNALKHAFDLGRRGYLHSTSPSNYTEDDGRINYILKYYLRDKEKEAAKKAYQKLKDREKEPKKEEDDKPANNHIPFTLKESQLRNMIAESIKRVLSEMETPYNSGEDGDNDYSYYSEGFYPDENNTLCKVCLVGKRVGDKELYNFEIDDERLSFPNWIDIDFEGTKKLNNGHKEDANPLFLGYDKDGRHCLMNCVTGKILKYIP